MSAPYGIWYSMLNKVIWHWFQTFKFKAAVLCWILGNVPIPADFHTLLVAGNEKNEIEKIGCEIANSRFKLQYSRKTQKPKSTKKIKSVETDCNNETETNWFLSVFSIVNFFHFTTDFFWNRKSFCRFWHTQIGYKPSFAEIAISKIQSKRKIYQFHHWWVLSKVL